MSHIRSLVGRRVLLGVFSAVAVAAGVACDKREDESSSGKGSTPEAKDEPEPVPGEELITLDELAELCPQMLGWPVQGSELSAEQPVEGCPTKIRVLATVSDIVEVGRMRAIYAKAPGGRWDEIDCAMYAETSPTYKSLVEGGLKVGSQVVCTGLPMEAMTPATKKNVLHLGTMSDVALR